MGIIKLLRLESPMPAQADKARTTDMDSNMYPKNTIRFVYRPLTRKLQQIAGSSLGSIVPPPSYRRLPVQ